MISFLPTIKDQERHSYNKRQIDKGKAYYIFITIFHDMDDFRLKTQRCRLEYPFLCLGSLKYGQPCGNMIGQKQ
jgi:hypothetical protein